MDIQPDMLAKYTVDFYLEKFKATDPLEWTTGAFIYYGGARHSKCAFGWCGLRNYTRIVEVPEADGLQKLFRNFGIQATVVNDDKDNKFGYGDNPRDRLIGALMDLRDGFCWEHSWGREYVKVKRKDPNGS